jgi:hypothetical protein
MPYTDATDAEKDQHQTAIARALPPGWSAEPANGSHGRTLRHVDGYGVLFETCWDKPKRLKISGVWPQDSTGHTHHPYTGAPSITVSAEKSAKAIADDIERRLLPEYLEHYRQQYAKAEEASTYERETEATIHAIEGVTASLRGAHNKAIVYPYRSHVDKVTAQGPAVRFEAFNCPLAVALRILPLLREVD